MKPASETSVVVVDEISDFITNIQPADLRSNFAIRTRGFRHVRAGIIGERDWGTRQRYANYPSALLSHIDAYLLYIPEDIKEYLVLVGLDSANNMRIFVDDGTANGNWTELSRKLSAKINDGSIAATDVTITVDTLKDILSTTIAVATNEFLYYICVNQTGVRAGQAVLILSNTSRAADGGTFTITGEIYLGSSGLGWLNSDVLFLYNMTGIYDGYNFSNGTNPHIRWLETPEQRKVNLYYGNSSSPSVTQNPLQIRKAKFLRPEAFNKGADAGGGWIAKSGSIEFLDILTTEDVTGIATAQLTVTTPGVVNNGSGLCRVRVSAHGLTTGDKIFISGILGVASANGAWKITVIDADNFDLQLSTFSGTWTSGGRLEFVWLVTKVRPNFVGGNIYFSSSGGNSFAWELSLTGHFQAIQMIDRLTGYAVGTLGAGGGGFVYKTTDGGASWVDKSPAGMAAGSIFKCLHFLDASNGWVAGSQGGIYKTTNGGTNWTAQPIVQSQGTATGSILTIFAVSSTLIYVTTDVIDWFGFPSYITGDGGTTWSGPVIAFGDNSEHGTPWVRSFYFNDSTHGWAVDKDSKIYGWNGTVWTFLYQVNPGGTKLNSIKMFNNLDGRVAGDPHPLNQTTIYRTTDGGAIWKAEASPFKSALLAQSYFDVDNGYVAGESGTVAKLSGVINASVPLSLGTGWYIDKAQLTPKFIGYGTPTGPKDGTSKETLRDDIGDGIRIQVQFFSRPNAVRKHVRVYVVLRYAGQNGVAYQRSDPVMQLCVSVPAGFLQVPVPRIRVDFDLSKLNKNVVGFEVYEAIKSDTDIANDLANWTDQAGDYILLKEVLVSESGWVKDPTTRFNYQYAIDLTPELYETGATVLGGATLLSNLGHDVSKIRTYYSPAYAVKTMRGQSAAIAIPIDNNTILFSCYSGAGAHMDDAFVDISIDNQDRIQKLLLLGKGDVVGLAVLSDTLVVLRATEIELRDLQSTIGRFIPADISSKDSVVTLGVDQSSQGIAWAGRQALYMMNSSFIIREINTSWRNFYNGDLITQVAYVPFVSNVARSAILGTFNQDQNELWFSILCATEVGTGSETLVFRWNFKKWYIRKFNLTGGAPTYFTKARDGTIVIGSSVGALTYPLKGLRTITISNVTQLIDGGYNIRITTAVAHGLTTGQTVLIAGVAGVPNANGTFVIIVIGSTTFDLFATWGGAYIKGGAVYVDALFEDEVAFSGASTGKGIETSLKINLGSLYALYTQFVVQSFLLDFVASGTGRYRVKAYNDNLATAYETKTALVTDRASPRVLPAVGSMSSAQIEIDIPSTEVLLVRNVEIGRLEIQVKRVPRLGQN